MTPIARGPEKACLREAGIVGRLIIITSVHCVWQEIFKLGVRTLTDLQPHRQYQSANTAPVLYKYVLVGSFAYAYCVNTALLFSDHWRAPGVTCEGLFANKRRGTSSERK